MDPITAALGLVSVAAPYIGKWLGGSDGEDVATKVVAAAQAVTGANTTAQAASALAADPTLQLQFQTHMATLNADLERAYLQDRQSARQRDVELAKSGRSNVRADLMVAGVTLGLIACIGVLAFYRNQVPGEVVGILSTVAGIFGACLKDAFAFEFGSSRSSKEKDALIAQSIGGGRG
ncbi:hypothetical protein ACFQPI_18440 [Insolitispirillum peregrinum]